MVLVRVPWSADSDSRIWKSRKCEPIDKYFLDPYMTQKLSKATILSKTIDYIERITDEKKRDENELQKLNREVKGLKIQFDEYSRLIKKTRSNPQYQSNLWNDFLSESRIMNSVEKSL